MCGTIDLLITHSSCVCVTWCIHMCDMTHLYTWHDSFIGVTWRDLPIWETYSFMCVTWLIHVCDHRLSSLPIALVCVIWLIHTRDKPRSYVCAVPYICDIHSIITHSSCMCNMTHSYAWQASFIRVCRAIYMWLHIYIHLTHILDSYVKWFNWYICRAIYMWHIYVTYICAIYMWLHMYIHLTHSHDSLTWLTYMTHSYGWRE